MTVMNDRDRTATRFPSGVYGVTPEWDDTARLAEAVRAAARGGMRALQLRRKQASPERRRRQAETLAALCRELGVVFMVNDDWRLALDVGADGAHLGREDGAIEAARRAAGAGLILGSSCYDDLERARAMLAAGADYIAFGAVYASSSKPQAVRAPLALLGQARALVDALPAPRPAVVAIGGITPENAAAVAQAGAESLAMISGLFDAPDIEAAARSCLPLFFS